MIVIGEGSATIQNLKFVYQVTNSLHYSLIFVTGRRTTITNCQFDSFHLYDTIVYHRTNSLVIEHTRFTNVTLDPRRNDEFGAVLVTTIDKDSSLTMNNITLQPNTFPSELVEDQSMLKVYLQMTGTANLKLTDLKYLEPDSPLPTIFHFVWIVGKNINTQFTKDDTRFAGSYSSSTPPHYLWTTDETDRDNPVDASLLLFLVGKGSAVGLSDTGEDSSDCGFLGKWCQTFQKAQNRAEEEDLNAINIHGSATITGENSIDVDFSITGTSSTSSFTFRDKSMLAVNSVATFSNLLLTTTPNADGSLTCTLYVQSGHLTLSKVKIIIEGTMDNYAFLSVPFGTLTLTDVSVDGGSRRHTLSFVIVQQTGSLRSTKTTVKNIHSPYAAWMARLTGTELSIGSPESQSVFSNCVGDHVDPIPQASVGGGALFVSLTGAASKLAISNTLFEKCWSGLDGGAIFVSFSSSSLPSNYRISATFSECKVSTAEGRGKWVFVEGYNLPSFIREEEWEGTLTRVNRREHLEMLWGEDLSAESTFGSNSLLDILRPATDATSLFVDSKSEHGERNCGETEHTACPTIDAALLQVATANTELVLSNSPLLSAHFVVSRQELALIGFSSSSTSRPLSKLRVNATGFGGMGGVICGTNHSVLTLLNVEITTMASSDGSALFLFVVRDSEMTLTNCWVSEVSASVGFVECLSASSLSITHLTITSSSFSSTLFSLSDTSFLSISESEWRTVRVTKGGLVELRGWPSQNIVFSKFELSACLSSQPTQPLLSLSLSGAPSPTDRRQVSFSNCKFASSSSSPAPFVAMECVGVSVDVVAVKSEMLCSSGAATGSHRGMVVEWKERQPFVIRRELKMTNCSLIVAKL